MNFELDNDMSSEDIYKQDNKEQVNLNQFN